MNNGRKKSFTSCQIYVATRSTIKETALYFNLSESTIYYIIEKKLSFLKPNLYKEVKKVQILNENNGKIIGGEKSKASIKYNEDQLAEIVKSMIKNKKSLREVTKETGIPRSTLYDRVKRIKDEELKREIERLYEYNKTLGKTKERRFIDEIQFESVSNTKYQRSK